MKLELDPVNKKNEGISWPAAEWARLKHFLFFSCFFFLVGKGLFVLLFRVVDSRCTLRSSVLETVRVKYCSNIFFWPMADDCHSSFSSAHYLY